MNILENINKTVVPEMDWDTGKNISYTQLSLWSECPHKWEMMYIHKMKQPPSIYLSFGSAMHEVVQHFLDVMYNVTKKQALTPSVLIDLNYISWDSEFKFSRLIEGSIQFFVLPVPSLSYWRSYSQ